MKTIYVDWRNEVLATGMDDLMDALDSNHGVQEEFEEFLGNRFSCSEIYYLTEQEKEDIDSEFYDNWIRNCAEAFNID